MVLYWSPLMLDLWVFVFSGAFLPSFNGCNGSSDAFLCSKATKLHLNHESSQRRESGETNNSFALLFQSPSVSMKTTCGNFEKIVLTKVDGRSWNFFQDYVVLFFLFLWLGFLVRCHCWNLCSAACDWGCCLLFLRLRARKSLVWICFGFL